MKIGLIFSIAAAVIGDFSGKYLAEYQPEKLAAAEWHFETHEGAPLMLYGVLDDGEVKYALKIPYALSILAHSDPSAEVIGLNEFPEDEIPPLYIHYLFDGMVTIGMWMMALSLVYVVGVWMKWSFIRTRWYRWLIVFGGPLSMLAIELGWWFAEVGRQPWILRGIMKVEDAATTSGQVDLMLLLFAGLYLILAIGSTVVLTRMFRKNTVEQELADRELEKEGDFQ
ncbi:cytochrome d ubiquinol oxidase subunit I [Mesobacillus boroniphilus JCM 21738]|uniref:Cytochrome d ubiquinol oxidase subunit I n=1 Tax=Mesobacillus boroniphilus JCM 21738 TaxID=1294265 RepID=W4RPA0_9BACI|nr:cytochrome d ubiquinol oxidase subunit I [Mesobacillus boroniphilus JCM 21738]